MAMPSVLWSASARLRGLRRSACVIVRVSDQSELALQQLRLQYVAQLEQSVSLLLSFGPDLVMDDDPLLRPRRVDEREGLHAFLRVAASLGQQPGPGAVLRRHRRLDALRGIDGAAVAVLQP